jgi:hypothetical protein
MISYFILKKIESTFGAPVRYPKDCINLSNSIKDKTKNFVSSSTIMRMFGIVPSTITPRLHTLDIIANYIGYENWDSAEKGSKFDFSKGKHPIYITPHHYSKNQLIRIKFNDSSTLELLCVDKNRLLVTNSVNFNLIDGDILEFFRIEVDFLFICETVFRDGKNIGSFFSKPAIIKSITLIN